MLLVRFLQKKQDRCTGHLYILVHSWCSSTRVWYHEFGVLYYCCATVVLHMQVSWQLRPMIYFPRRTDPEDQHDNDLIIYVLQRWCVASVQYKTNSRKRGQISQIVRFPHGHMSYRENEIQNWEQICPERSRWEYGSNICLRCGRFSIGVMLTIKWHYSCMLPTVRCLGTGTCT